MSNQNEFIIHEHEKDYHAQAKDNLSSHQLANFRKSARLYQRKKLGLIPDVDRPAYLIGRAAHTLILEGERVFDDTYTVGTPINPKTGNPYGSSTKAYEAWAAEHGQPVLTDTQFDLIMQLADSVKSHEMAKLFLLDGVAEGVIRTTYCGLPSQTRMDWFSEEHGLIDLKTCDNLTWFESDARRYDYAYQMAFYRSVLEVVSGITYPVHIIAVEKREPFRCGVWRVGEDVLGIAQKENEAAIEQTIFYTY